VSTPWPTWTSSAPGREVRAFGSRALEKAKPFSDLDLAVMGESPLGDSVLADLLEAFRETDLPFRLDVLDWAETGESFRQVVPRGSVVLAPEGAMAG
jgi:predicted nucleotidyltransferase